MCSTYRLDHVITPKGTIEDTRVLVRHLVRVGIFDCNDLQDVAEGGRVLAPPSLYVDPASCQRLLFERVSDVNECLVEQISNQ